MTLENYRAGDHVRYAAPSDAAIEIFTVEHVLRVRRAYYLALGDPQTHELKRLVSEKDLDDFKARMRKTALHFR